MHDCVAFPDTCMTDLDCTTRIAANNAELYERATGVHCAMAKYDLETDEGQVLPNTCVEKALCFDGRSLHWDGRTRITRCFEFSCDTDYYCEENDDCNSYNPENCVCCGPSCDEASSCSENSKCATDYTAYCDCCSDSDAETACFVDADCAGIPEATSCGTPMVNGAPAAAAYCVSPLLCNIETDVGGTMSTISCAGASKMAVFFASAAMAVYMAI